MGERGKTRPPCRFRGERDDNRVPARTAATDKRAGARKTRFRQDLVRRTAHQRARRGDVSGRLRVALEPRGDAVSLVRIEPPVGERRYVEQALGFILDHVGYAAKLPKITICSIHPRSTTHRVVPISSRLHTIL
jgi:hypothetical protein